jgi:hypothetical protein
MNKASSRFFSVTFGVLINLLVIGVNKHLHTLMRFVFVGFYMNGIATVAAIFKVILIFTTDIQRDMGRVAAKRTNNGFVN